MPPTCVVELIKDAPDAVGKVAGDSGAGPTLRVGEEGVGAEVVGADPQGVDRVLGLAPVARGEQRVGARRRVLKRHVGQERGDLIVGDEREGPLERREVSLDEVVRARGPADCEIGSCVSK